MAGDCFRFAGNNRGSKEFQPDCFLGIAVGDLLNLLEDFYFDSKFFADFTDEALAKCFVGFNFSTWEFPQPAQMIVQSPLGNEEFAVPKDNGSRNIDYIPWTGTLHGDYRPMLL